VITALDPGDFGTIPSPGIQQSVTIEGNGIAKIDVPSGGTGIPVDVGPAQTVVLRGLHIGGAGGGLIGIDDTSTGGTLYVENCTISNFANYGIHFAPTQDASLFVTDSTIDGNIASSVTAAPFPSAIALMQASTKFTPNVSIDRTKMQGYQYGLYVGGQVQAAVSNSVISGNLSHGVRDEKTFTNLVSIWQCMIANNGGSGIALNNSKATVLITYNTIVNNAAGLTFASTSSGSIVSLGSNSIIENNGKGADPSTTQSLR
jgi:hypothetical protein